MQKLILVALFFTTLAACKNGEKKVTFDTLTYEAVKESLADKEKKSPANFLTANIRHRKNIIGQTVVIGNISNHATICSYKDVELKLSFYSKTAVKLDEGIETVYENIAPGKTVKFKTKYFAPKGTDSVTVVIMKAVSEVNSLKN
jgi:hypothetical protein